MFISTKNKNFEDNTSYIPVIQLQNRRIESVPNTEQEAYDKAIKGYKYPLYFEIGSLKNIDLFEINQDPPNVDLETYKSLTLLDKSQLLKKAAGIERFYPNINKKDLFFYLTRGRLPEDTQIFEKLSRLNKFEKLLDINQDLLLLIYKTPEDFASASKDSRKKNIENLIFLYDELLGIKSTPGLISRMAGIDLKIPNLNVEEFLYSKLYRYIQVSSSQTPNTYNENGVKVLDFEDVISLNKDAWLKYINQNFPSTDPSYETRSDFIMREFYDLYSDLV